MSMTTARRVADAVLYEGYVLYPYRSSSAKNRLRWQFGVLGPIGAAEAGASEAPNMQAEWLIQPQQAHTAQISVHLRFLQAQFRAVETAAHERQQRYLPAAELQVGNARWVPWHEAIEREVKLPDLDLSDLFAGHSAPINIPGGEEPELLYESGSPVGRLVRTRWPLVGQVHISAKPIKADQPLVAIRVRVENLSRWQGTTTSDVSARDLAARRSFIGMHMLAEVRGGQFLSMTDPPTWAATAAAACENERCWPVLLGEEGSTDTLLVSPIILSDHPTVAEESPGDFFDATEIDEMLTLRVMTLTDDEKTAARGTDPRAAAIIERCDNISDDALERLHGTVRNPQAYKSVSESSVNDSDRTVWIAGIEVGQGCRVLIQPTRRADAQDLFLVGKIGVVAAVHSDFDDQTHVAVTLEDDPGSDLHKWYGRYYYFAPDELKPISSLKSGPEVML